MITSNTKENITDQSARELVNNLAILIRTSQIHNINNVAVKKAVNKILDVITPILSEEFITLQLIGQFFQLNGNRVRYTVENSTNFNFLIEVFGKAELGTIKFTGKVTEEEIMIFLTAVKESEKSDSPFESIEQKLAGSNNIKVERLQKINEDISYQDKKRQIKKTYSNAVSITKGILNKIKSGESVSLKQSKRVVETITDQILDRENRSILIGLTTLKDHHDYTYNHSVNVSILTMAFGHRLGFKKQILAELGMAALFHDIGKMKVPVEILNKPSSLSNSEWAIMEQHPFWGAVTILKMKGMSELSINIAITALEHHLNYDRSGYPKLKESMPLEFYSNIIAIADQYDAMTSARVYARVAKSPDKALGIMIEERAKKLDPYLLKAFVQMIGIYPIGTLVVLDTGELGLVFENSPDQDYLDRPRVLIISDSSGERINDFVADLTEKNSNGSYTRSITKTLDPNSYGINLAEYLL